MDAAVETPTKRDRKINFVDTELRVLFQKYAASAGNVIIARTAHSTCNNFWVAILNFWGRLKVCRRECVLYINVLKCSIVAVRFVIVFLTQKSNI